ncbi:MAG: desulfoferrodoxin FeS4 iron-binding domain-containing protein [Clostridiaceae bacterium]|nr:desulfoferrodoxin FeS4 iron-binding domain-containing protein [Clostridiaceae bacterium]
MMSEVEFYRCGECGNIVALVNKGGGALVCCGQEMTRLVPNTVDASKEKHVPYVTKEDGKIRVAVGSTLHPMMPEHYIQWIALAAGDRLEFRYLKPGEEPVAEFGGAESGTVYEYCNLHGLWKADF